MTGSAPREGRRRALHLASAAPGLAACFGAPHRVISVTMLFLLTLALVLEALRRRLPSLQRALERVSLGAFRPAETRGVTGATLLAVGNAAAWFLFPATAAAPAMVVTATCDPAAATVGRLAVPGGGPKTWTGSAGAFVAAALTLALLGAGWRATLAAAAAATLAERVAGRGLDNVAIPLATAAMLWAQA